MLSTIATGLCNGFALAVRVCSAAVAVLLVLRSVAHKVVPQIKAPSMERFYRFTDVFVVPVKRTLPIAAAEGKTDFSPLIAALILLFFGLGLSVFLESIADGFVTL